MRSSLPHVRSGVVLLPLENRWVVRVWCAISIAIAAVGADLIAHGTMLGLLPLVIGAGLTYVTGRAAMAGGVYMLVDVAAGGVELVQHGRIVACSFDELGPLAIDEFTKPYTGRRSSLVRYRLRAPGLADVLAQSPSRERIEKLRAQLQARLDSLRVVASVRTLLAAASEGEGTYRAPPDLARAIARVVPDEAAREDALTWLCSDPDPEIRNRVRLVMNT